LMTSSVNNRTVQRVRPSGGGEQTTAIMRKRLTNAPVNRR
jgi:hypothetical protein